YLTHNNIPLDIFLFFFFSSRRRHTRSKRDWSSDVCSSDLAHRPHRRQNEFGTGSFLDMTVCTKTATSSTHFASCAYPSPYLLSRSEERRVGKECRSRGSASQ